MRVAAARRRRAIARALRARAEKGSRDDPRRLHDLRRTRSCRKAWARASTCQRSTASRAPTRALPAVAVARWSCACGGRRAAASAREGKQTADCARSVGSDALSKLRSCAGVGLKKKYAIFSYAPCTTAQHAQTCPNVRSAVRWLSGTCGLHPHFGPTSRSRYSKNAPFPPSVFDLDPYLPP